MIRICLVGEIGSGKTFVSNCFGYPVFNADKEVITIYKKSRKCFSQLKKKFPNSINRFPIKKSQIKKILNKKNIKFLSKIVHPYVRLSLKKFLKKNIKRKFVVLDIPLLIENKLYLKSDILIYVNTPKYIINKRLKKRGTYNKKLIKILESQQLKKIKKKNFCNFVIENVSDKNNILKQIKSIKKKIND
tara:strand:- start:3704 stop:4270 length:567 start_codon:yes stop_codon:yes gene_type:complete